MADPRCGLGLHDPRRLPRTDFAITVREDGTGSTRTATTWWACGRCGIEWSREAGTLTHFMGTPRLDPYYVPRFHKAECPDGVIAWTVPLAGAEDWDYAEMRDHMQRLGR